MTTLYKSTLPNPLGEHYPRLHTISTDEISSRDGDIVLAFIDGDEIKNNTVLGILTSEGIKSISPVPDLLCKKEQIRYCEKVISILPE